MMTGLLRSARAALFLALLGCGTLAGATAFSTNFSDLWWNPSESGWGVNITQQDDTMFATFFVYALDSKAHWYITTLRFQGNAADGSPIFTGDMYETSGPWFGGVFNPTAVTIQKVGAATFTGNGSTQASLQYTINNIPVSKQIQRQTLRANTVAGSYLGGTSDITFACSDPSRNGEVTEDGGGIAITQNANLVTIHTPTCTFTGTYVQNGQVGSMTAGYNCTTGATGTISFTDIYVETSGIIGRYSGNDGSCSFVGTIGGARRK